MVQLSFLQRSQPDIKHKDLGSFTSRVFWSGDYVLVLEMARGRFACRNGLFLFCSCTIKVIYPISTRERKTEMTKDIKLDRCYESPVFL